MPNTTLKSSSHTDYDTNESWWDRTTGVARLNQGYTLDAPLSAPTADPGYTLYAVFNAAVDSENVVASSDTRIGVGIYAKQSGLPGGEGWDWLYGAHTVTAEVSGTVATPTVRYYMVHTRTSRGFLINSSITTVSSAPSNADFSGGARVFLSWPKAVNFGVISYDVYRWNKTADFTDTDVNTGADTITVDVSIPNNTKVILVKGAGALPSPLQEGVTYYVVNQTPTTVQLSLTQGGSPIDLTTTGDAVTHNVAIDGVLLQRVESGLTSMRDSNSTVATDQVAPTADFTGLRAYTATAPGVIRQLSVNGVNEAWDTLPFAVRVPANFNKGAMTDTQRYKQWLRIKLFGADGTTNRLNWRATNMTATFGSNTFVSDGTAFTGMTGRSVRIFNPKDPTAIFLTGTIAGVGTTNVADDTINLSIGEDWNFDTTTNAIAEVTGGAPSGAIHIDLVHMSYGPNAIFAFHPDDLSPDRGEPPVAPNGSTQGGTTIITGGGDGGTIFNNTCVSVDEMVTVTDGQGSIFRIPAGSLDHGSYLFNHAKRITTVSDIKYHRTTIWRTETENGFWGDTSESHKYLTSPDDTKGTPLRGLDAGDAILTCVDGENVMTTIKAKYPVGQGVVAEIDLPMDRRYLLGQWEEGVCRKWGGIASHNKREQGQVIIFES